MKADILLDDRTYRDLIEEARSRVQIACPELMVNGLPDASGALIELFTWMTGLTIERLNRVPEKLHIALLSLLGIELHGPSAARTGLRMRLSAPPTEPIEFRAGTEAGTLRTATRESTVFQVQDDFTILPTAPEAYVIERAGAQKAIGVADGVAIPHGPDRLAFAKPPQIGDALYLGFDRSIAKLVLRISIEASMARGAGVKPEDPPLRWECSQGEGLWADADVLQDLTGGFNYGSGTVELQCPATSGLEPMAGHRLYWVRCRIAETTRVSGEQAVYTQPPEIFKITAAPTGALLPGENSVIEREEEIGTSDGNPGQMFSLRFDQVLELREGETLEVQAPSGDWEPWDLCESFVDSGPEDRHYVIDLVHGRIRLGPQLRRSNSNGGQYGAIPPKGAGLRMSKYRHGGGRVGNVRQGELTTLRSAIPGVASVTNPEPAVGGVDPQSLESVRERGAMELRTRYRAVTTEDFEFLATEASPRVARAHRVRDGEPGVTLRLLPRVDPADRRLSIGELTPDADLLDAVERHLNARKLVGTAVRLLPMRFRAVSVIVNLQAKPRADPQRIERELRRALYVYLNPLLGGTADEIGKGWPVGRSLNQGELYSIVHSIDGVEFIKVLRLYEMDLATGVQAGQPAGRQVTIDADEVIASGDHRVRVVRGEP